MRVRVRVRVPDSNKVGTTTTQRDGEERFLKPKEESGTQASWVFEKRGVQVNKGTVSVMEELSHHVGRPHARIALFTSCRVLDHSRVCAHWIFLMHARVP